MIASGLDFSNVHPAWFVSGSLVVALLPVLVGLATSYLKVSVALGVLRNGFGAQQVPSGLVILVLSVAVTLQVMRPVFSEIKVEALQGAIDLRQPPSAETVQVFAPLVAPWRRFLELHTGVHELAMLHSFSTKAVAAQGPQIPVIVQVEDVSLIDLLPAFVMTELKQGLTIGFVLLLPFLVIDLIVANVLAGMGMSMVSPPMVALPLKLLLFVSADGWLLIVKGLIASYGVSP